MDEIGMPKWQIDLELRLSAVEFLLVEVAKIALLNAGVTTEMAHQMRETTRDKLLSNPFPGPDPVKADHAGAEFADRVDALLGRIESLVEASYLKARREGL